MAEPVSSILTIATVSLALITETVKYINDIRLVDRLVDRLVVKLKDLHRLIKLVESTYQRVDYEETSEATEFIRKHLITCRDRLTDIKSMVRELAARESETFIQKASLKRRLDVVKKDIEAAIDDIHCYMEYIRTGISLDVASTHRRISEALAGNQAATVRIELQNSGYQPGGLDNASDSVPPIDDLKLPLDGDIPLRKLSTATTQSRPSIYSISSQAWTTQSDDNTSTISPRGSPSLKSEIDGAEFLYLVRKCKRDEARIERIHKVLKSHTAAPTLIQACDESRRTPLHLAAQRGDVQLAIILLKFKADINAKDSEPASVLDLAVSNKHRDFVELLLDRGVDETQILSQNMPRFREMKVIIEFSKKASQNKSKR